MAKWKTMKRALVIAALVWLLLLALLLQTSIKDWVWTHPWWHALLVALPGIVTGGIALLELRHSGEANELRRQNNELRETLDSERNQHLEDIAKHTKPQPTAAERMAAKLRAYIGRSAMVTEGKGAWGSSIQVAEVNEDCIATLFSPAPFIDAGVGRQRSLQRSRTGRYERTIEAAREQALWRYDGSRELEALGGS